MAATLTLTGEVVRDHRPPPPRWLAEKVIGRVDGPGAAIAQLVATGPAWIERRDRWAGTGTLAFGAAPADELIALAPREIGPRSCGPPGPGHRLGRGARGARRPDPRPRLTPPPGVPALVGRGWWRHRCAPDRMHRMWTPRTTGTPRSLTRLVLTYYRRSRSGAMSRRRSPPGDPPRTGSRVDVRAEHITRPVVQPPWAPPPRPARGRAVPVFAHRQRHRPRAQRGARTCPSSCRASRLGPRGHPRRRPLDRRHGRGGARGCCPDPHRAAAGPGQGRRPAHRLRRGHAATSS